MYPESFDLMKEMELRHAYLLQAKAKQVESQQHELQAQQELIKSQEQEILMQAGKLVEMDSLRLQKDQEIKALKKAKLQWKVEKHRLQQRHEEEVDTLKQQIRDLQSKVEAASVTVGVEASKEAECKVASRPSNEGALAALPRRGANFGYIRGSGLVLAMKVF